jgi:hypothetical protein
VQAFFLSPLRRYPQKKKEKKSIIDSRNFLKQDKRKNPTRRSLFYTNVRRRERKQRSNKEILVNFCYQEEQLDPCGQWSRRSREDCGQLIRKLVWGGTKLVWGGTTARTKTSVLWDMESINSDMMLSQKYDDLCNSHYDPFVIVLNSAKKHGW